MSPLDIFNDNLMQETLAQMDKFANECGFSSARQLLNFINNFDGDIDSVANLRLRSLMHKMVEQGYQIPQNPKNLNGDRPK